MTAVLQGRTAFARTPKGGNFKGEQQAPLPVSRGPQGENIGLPPQTNGVWKRIAPKGQEVPPENCGGNRGEQRGGRNGAKGGFKRYEACDDAISPGNFLGTRQGLSF